MEDDEPKLGPIERPRKFPKNKVVRAAAKAAAGAVPYAGSTLAEIADACVPDHEAKDRTRWEGEVTEGVNTLHDRVDDIDERTGERRVTLTGGAAVAAKFMIEHCADGLARDDVSVEDIQQAYPDESRDEILDGLGDLESHGLIESTSFIGADDIYQLTQYGYEVLDRPIKGWDTFADARKIAELVTKTRDGVSVRELDVELGWLRRRFNPALRIVVNFIHPGRVSQELQPIYVTNYFSPDNAEMARLRRFAAGE